MITREDLRIKLYNELKDILKVPIKDRGLVYFKDLPNGYERFKAYYFQSMELFKTYPNSGTKNLYKIYKATYDNTKLDEKKFVQKFACDLNYAKSHEYCRVEPRDFTDYYGKYNNEKLGTGEIKESTDITGGAISIINMMVFEIKLKNIPFIFQLKPTGKKDIFDAINVDILNPTNIVNVGQIIFHDTFIDPDTNQPTPFTWEGSDKPTIGAFTFDVKNGIGTNLIADKYYFNYLNPEEGQDSEDEKIEIITDPEKPPTPQPQPPTPQPSKYKNYCSTMSLPWLVGCENEIIEYINKRLNNTKDGAALTTDLLKKLRGYDMITTTKDEINMKDYEEKIVKAFPELRKLEENKSQKKVIKESVRRILKDIYKRS
jgi:hypothetical protein